MLRREARKISAWTRRFRQTRHKRTPANSPEPALDRKMTIAPPLPAPPAPAACRRTHAATFARRAALPRELRRVPEAHTAVRRRAGQQLVVEWRVARRPDPVAVAAQLQQRLAAAQRPGGLQGGGVCARAPLEAPFRGLGGHGRNGPGARASGAASPSTPPDAQACTSCCRHDHMKRPHSKPRPMAGLGLREHSAQRTACPRTAACSRRPPSRCGARCWAPSRRRAP